MLRSRILSVLPLALVLLACRSKSGSSVSPRGRLEARWTDSARSAHLSAPARAFWCAADTLLEIHAIRNDSVLGLALYPKDSLRATAFPVAPASVYTPWRPQSSGALRLLGLTDIRGYESTWGQVVVTEVSAQGVSGTFDLHFQLSAGRDSLHVTGSFSKLGVAPAPLPCGRVNKPRAG